MGEDSHDHDDHYEPRDTFGEARNGFLAGGGIGLLFASIQNALAKQNIGAMGVFWRGGTLITGMSGTLGAYYFTTAAVSNLRQKNDPWNSMTGGFTAGAIQGLIARSMPKVFGFGFGFAGIMALSGYTGGIWGHMRAGRNPDEYEDKERQRLNRRVPIEETLKNIGEGRGIRPPGYEERRVQRLKETYGIEVKTVSALATDEDE